MTKAPRTTRRRALAAAAALALAGGALACNLILDTSSFSVCSSIEDAGFYDAGCLACVESSCCDEATACVSDPVCAAQQRCLGEGFPLLSCPLAGGVSAFADSTPADAGPLGACAAGACAAACGPWACVNAVSSWPAPPANAGDVTVTIVPTVFNGCVDTPDTSPALVVQVTRCNGGGGACELAFGGPPTSGPVSVQVPQGFRGYLDVVPAAPDGGAEGVPLHALVYLSWPIVADTTVELRFLTTSLLAAVAAQLGVVELQADAGTLVVFARDCLGNPAGGVTLTPASATYLDPDPFAPSDAFNFPSCTVAQGAPADGVQAPTTTANGIAGWSQLDPDYTRDSGLAAPFTASLGGGATPIGCLAPLVQAQTVTYVWLGPTPPCQL